MTCSQCGAPAVRTIAAYSYCNACAEALLEPIRQRVAAREISQEPGLGFGLQDGPLRPDWGDGWAELKCDVCGAGWVGPLGETCDYCLRWLELAQETQRRVLLHPDLPEPDNELYDTALQTWAKRLAGAVVEELITEHELRAAWKRQVPDVAV